MERSSPRKSLLPLRVFNRKEQHSSPMASSSATTAEHDAEGEPSPRSTWRPQPEERDLPSYIKRDTGAAWLSSLSNVAEITAYKAISYNLLAPRSGTTILDLGCGVGDDARMIALRVAPDGLVIGVDQDERMIKTANERQKDAPPSLAQIQFMHADAERLPFQEAYFDGARVDRMLQHVGDPAEVLREISRVLKPQGRVVLVEPDWPTISLYPGSADGDESDSTFAKILAWHVAHTPHPRIGRQLRSLLKDAEFTGIETYPMAFATVHLDIADLVLELSQAAQAEIAEPHSTLTQEELDGWLAVARKADADERFFVSVPLVFARGRKP